MPGVNVEKHKSVMRILWANRLAHIFDIFDLFDIFDIFEAVMMFGEEGEDDNKKDECMIIKIDDDDILQSRVVQLPRVGRRWHCSLLDDMPVII